jgi:uncharacterized repeat protein (TIGR03837 family)
MQWDLFCRVIDNHGDIGVCWRLAADLAARGEQVRLWVDDTSALRWMAPSGAPNVEVRPWPQAPVPIQPGEVVVEAFGCALPPWWVQGMHRQAHQKQPTPVWINLEYLSAEGDVERSHQLLSPQFSTEPDAPFEPLRKWFFYPGYTQATGGLLREPGLAVHAQNFDRQAWLAARGVALCGQEQVVSLFCYEQPALPALLRRLAQQPTWLLVTAGHAERQVRAQLGPSLALGQLRAVVLPLLPQPEFDHLLWASDLNFVRGEDSWVRAQWAGKSFVWQIYPQDDGVHALKLQAFLDRHLAGAPPGLAQGLRLVWHDWNVGAVSQRPLNLPACGAQSEWGRHCVAWRDGLASQVDLATQLLQFAGAAR